MLDFIVWIVSADNRLSEAWYRLFSRELLHVERLETLNALDRASEGVKGLALITFGLDDLNSPSDLKNFIAGRKNISAIVVAPKIKVTNQIIAELLESGADDFIQADIDERVLLSKVRAHLRRTLPNLACSRTLVLSRNGDIELDRTRRTIRTGLKGRKPAEVENITPKEFDILSTLLCTEEQVVTRNFLMDELWKEKSGQLNFETIDKHVETLRHKLGQYGRNIRTVYGEGYMYKVEPVK
jgi:DNA-binding response OmpR family regulator